MTEEQLATARDAVQLHKQQQALREQGLLPPEGEGGAEGKEADDDDEAEGAWETWLDNMITYVAAIFGVIALIISIVIGVGLGVTTPH